jgi:predicted transglutaminase-like cysteine proteinase
MDAWRFISSIWRWLITIIGQSRGVFRGSVWTVIILCGGLSAARYDGAPFVDFNDLQQLNDKYGEPAYQRGLAVNRMIERVQAESITVQLNEVNHFYNQFGYVSDIELWKKEDYWATPLEFLGRGGGDCEDYVFSKYFVLRALGVGDEHLYITYVKALKQNVAHMVLSYFDTPESIPLILDNYNPRILKADKRIDLLPIYSFNANSLFLAKAAGLGKALPSDKIKNRRWDQLLLDYAEKKL